MRSKNAIEERRHRCQTELRGGVASALQGSHQILDSSAHPDIAELSPYSKCQAMHVERANYSYIHSSRGVKSLSGTAGERNHAPESGREEKYHKLKEGEVTPDRLRQTKSFLVRGHTSPSRRGNFILCPLSRLSRSRMDIE